MEKKIREIRCYLNMQHGYDKYVYDSLLQIQEKYQIPTITETIKLLILNFKNIGGLDIDNSNFLFENKQVLMNGISNDKQKNQQVEKSNTEKTEPVIKETVTQEQKEESNVSESEIMALMGSSGMGFDFSDDE